MGYFGYGMMGPYAWPWMVMMAVFWIGLIALGLWTVSRLAPHRFGDRPLDILKQRYARGEITREQYEEARKLLST